MALTRAPTATPIKWARSSRVLRSLEWAVWRIQTVQSNRQVHFKGAGQISLFAINPHQWNINQKQQPIEESKYTFPKINARDITARTKWDASFFVRLPKDQSLTCADAPSIKGAEENEASATLADRLFGFSLDSLFLFFLPVGFSGWSFST